MCVLGLGFQESPSDVSLYLRQNRVADEFPTLSAPVRHPDELRAFIAQYFEEPIGLALYGSGRRKARQRRKARPHGRIAFH